MTEPTEPAAAPAPTEPATPPAPAAAAPTEPAAKVVNPWEDPEKAKAEIERLRRENASDRTQAKANAAEQARAELAQEIGKALGIVDKGEPVDPAKLTEQLTAAQAATRDAQIELAVWRAAGDQADAAALLDSRSFVASLAGVDPADTSALSERIAAAVAENPRLARGQQPAAPTGRMAPNRAQGASQQPLGLKERIAAAERDGDPRTAARLKAALVLQNSN